MRWGEAHLDDLGWLHVPSDTGEIEIAGDVVRIKTDDAYYEHMKAIGGAA